MGRRNTGLVQYTAKVRAYAYAYGCRSGGGCLRDDTLSTTASGKEGKGSNATGTADEEQEEPGAVLLDKLEKGAGRPGSL